MKDLFENAPKIISEAAKSPLGISALLILSVSAMAWLLFDEASEILKTAIFIAILLFFVLLLHYSYTHHSENSEKDDPDKTPAEHNSIQEIMVSQLPRTEEITWCDPTDKRKRYKLKTSEVQILETLRGKPDVRWTKDLIVNSSKKPVDFSRDELMNAIYSLQRNKYIGCNQDDIYHVLDLAISYYRSTDNRKTYEIDPADYWDGT